MTNRILAAIAALAGALTVTGAAPSTPVNPQSTPTAAPRLMVIVVVDQLRSDYLDRYSARWTGGLKRLMQEGAWYTKAAYPYLHTVTCPGHATIGTGRFPRGHGIIMNSWFSRELGSTVDCSGDTDASTVTAEGLLPGGHSARQLKADTLAERVKRGGGRVVTMSLKPRSAIMPAGRRSDATIWFGGRGSFVTSTAFTEALPAFAKDVTTASPVLAERVSPPWVKLLPADSYSGPDDGVGEKPPNGWTAMFPHPFDLPQFLSLWQSSPLSDAYLGRLADAAIDAFKLGQGSSVDLLSVSFSALDVVGHAFGPESHEVQDLLARLDLTLGALLSKLDERVGRGNYVLALTSDHGVAPIPEQAKMNGEDAGRIDTRGISRAIEEALQTALGPGQYVAAVVYTDIYFRPGVWDRVSRNREALEAVKKAVLAAPGVERIYDARQLQRPDGHDPLLRAASTSWFKDRSGDLVFVPKRFWIASSAATTHGTLHDYDQRVPLIFAGPPALVRAGRYENPATPADIAPTLGRLSNVKFETPDGHVLPVHP
jgi:arylsulfatase A-like enzyme